MPRGFDERRRRLNRLAIAALISASIGVSIVAPRGGIASADPLVDALATDDPRALGRAIAAIESAPAMPLLAPALLAAARACEDRLHDPLRARGLYARITRELPDASVAIVAQRRLAALDTELGPHGEYAHEASALSLLIATADRAAPESVVRDAESLITAAWPGAAEAELWLAEWLRRSGRGREALVRYADVMGRWPTSPQAGKARRGGAGCALELHDWARAQELARLLPDDASDGHLRDDLIAAASRGLARDRWYVAAWIALGLAFVSLLGSLAEAALRGGARRLSWRPPIEIVFLGPVSGVLIAIAITAHRAIAPAVATISVGGLILAWLSGAGLETARRRGRTVRIRAIVHVLLCFAGVVALGYIAMTRDGLIDLLAETVRFGPEAN